MSKPNHNTELVLRYFADRASDVRDEVARGDYRAARESSVFLQRALEELVIAMSDEEKGE
jgi:hypothetical protein